MKACVKGAELALVCLPALAHEQTAIALAGTGAKVPVVLNPGGVGGTLHFSAALAREGRELELAEFSTATHISRVIDGRASVTGRAGRLWGAAHPGGERALELGSSLFAAVTPAADVLATGLANVNFVLHPPGAILTAAWVEATGGDFRFYGEATTPGVIKAMRRLDEERLAVAAAARTHVADAARGDDGLRPGRPRVRRSRRLAGGAIARRGKPQDPRPRFARAPLLPRGLRFRARPLHRPGRDRRRRGPVCKGAGGAVRRDLRL